MSENFTYEVDDNFEEKIIEEHGNTYISIRKIRWGEQKDFKLDIRKYIATAEGPRMQKGCSMTDEGANELTQVLLESGYGNANSIASSIIENRKDIYANILAESENLSEDEKQEIISNYYQEDNSDHEYYNLKEVI